MKVLFATYPTAFMVPGGGEVQLLKTRAHLCALGVQVDLFDPWRPVLDDADLVHVFSVHGGTFPLYEFCFERGLRVVVSPVLWPEGDHGYPIDRIAPILARVDGILPNSRAEQHLLAEVFALPSERFHVVPNGVDPDWAPGPGPEPFRRKTGFRDFVLCVGNVEPRKNQLALARACRGLGRNLVLIGGVRDEAYLRACVAEGGGCVQHAGRLDPAEPAERELLQSAYQAAAVHALVSTCETPGLATLEAAALGARVVSTDRGSAREYLGDQAHYVDPHDEAGIRAGLEAALADTRDPGARSRRVLDAFTWVQAAEATRDAYRAVLGG